MRASQTTMSNVNKSSARGTKQTLPNISTPSLSITYSQRYQHVTKIANYNQMHQNQIWKQYQKLRICLKELNDQVLYHMERKAYTNFKKGEVLSPDAQHQMALIEEEKRLNQERLTNFTNQYYQVEQRLKYLEGRKNIIEEIRDQIEETREKMRVTKIENKDYKRRSKMVAKEIENGPTLQEKVVYIDTMLASNERKKGKLAKVFQKINEKIKETEEKCAELHKTIELRLDQFNSQENFIEEQINFERYDQLKKQRDNAKRYESVYKRNYFMKLKELELLVNSCKKHDIAINENEANILTMRGDIDSLSSMVSNKQSESRRRAGSSMYLKPKQLSKDKKGSGSNRTMLDEKKIQSQQVIMEGNKENPSESQLKSDDKNRRQEINVELRGKNENQKKTSNSVEKDQQGEGEVGKVGGNSGQGGVVGQVQ